MPSFQRSRMPGLLAFSTALAIAFGPLARAQTAVPSLAAASPHSGELIRLEDVVVSATRTPQDPRTTPSAVTFIKPADLAASQIGDLRTALAAQAGVIIVNTGARGGPSAIFMRGANTDQVLFIVDGVRMNTTEAGYANFLGGADVIGVDRLEVLRGPQSTLYGSSAMGGVILMNTTHGCGPLTGTAIAEAGSFETFAASVALQGGTRTFGYSASLATAKTDNDRPNNTYQQTSYSSRLEWVVVPELLLGVTVRGQLGKYEEPGPDPLGFSSRGEVEVPNNLLTSYVQWSGLEGFRSRVTAGWHQTEYHWTDMIYGPSSDFYTRNTRQVLDWQNSWRATEWAELIAGANVERAHYTTGGTTLEDDQQGVYASGVLHPIKNLSLDLGVRSDDHDLEGRAETWRAGAAYWIAATATKLRATYGTGFKAPSMINRFGSPPWYAPSLTIESEESKGWDIGFDQELFDARIVASATYFRSDYDNLITNVFSMDLARFIATNVKTAETEGVEVGVTATLLPTVRVQASYTYLSALDTSGAKVLRIARRPRHTGDIDVRWSATKAWVLGAGCHFVSDRLASETAALAVRQEDYTAARFYMSYAVNDAISLKLRIENALNEEHAEVPGYAALPRGVFSSVEWRF